MSIALGLYLNGTGLRPYTKIFWRGKIQMQAHQKREITVRGTILPAEWDRHGHVTSIGIGTEEEEDYIIFLDKIGEKLFKLVDRKVEATGSVRNVYGDFVLTVNNYKLLQEDDGEE
jgi:hypothetical protein